MRNSSSSSLTVLVILIVLVSFFVQPMLGIQLVSAQDAHDAGLLEALSDTAEEIPASMAETPVPAVVQAPAEQDSPWAPDTGDTTWILVCSALVLAMTAPGLAIFYGGMARKKNALNTIFMSFIVLCLISVQWVLWGYSLAFAPDVGKVIGNLDWVFLNNVAAAGPSPYADTVPDYAFMVFQLVFAVITVALISGAIAERMKLSAFLLFAVVWTTFIYDPLAHWVWGGGWIGDMGALDFAGGTVVHISSAAAALAGAIMVGKRRGFLKEYMAPHNLPLTVIGASLLWFGWFGFNAGSALAAGTQAATAFVVTNTAAAMGGLSWAFAEWIYRGKPTALGAASGAVAGLVAITPAAGFVGPMSALVIGLGAGVFCYMAVFMKAKLGYDDALDVVAIHGVGGTWGALATGLFANPEFGGVAGAFFGNVGQFWKQCVAVGATWVFVFVGSLIILKIVDMIVGLRVNEEDEQRGLDLSQQNEAAYT